MGVITIIIHYMQICCTEKSSDIDTRGVPILQIHHLDLT